MAIGDIARKAPPPGALPKMKPMAGGMEPGEGSPDEEADDDAAALGLMEEFLSAVKGGDAKSALEAYRNLKDAY